MGEKSILMSPESCPRRPADGPAGRYTRHCRYHEGPRAGPRPGPQAAPALLGVPPPVLQPSTALEGPPPRNPPWLQPPWLGFGWTCGMATCITSSLRRTSMPSNPIAPPALPRASSVLHDLKTLKVHRDQGCSVQVRQEIHSSNDKMFLVWQGLCPSRDNILEFGKKSIPVMIRCSP